MSQFMSDCLSEESRVWEKKPAGRLSSSLGWVVLLLQDKQFQFSLKMDDKTHKKLTSLRQICAFLNVASSNQMITSTNSGRSFWLL